MPAPAPRVGSMRCWPSWCRAESPRKSRPIAPRRCSASVTPAGPVEAIRHALALEHLEDLRRIDEQMRASKRRIADAVTASATTTTEVFGIGPVGAAIAVGQTRDVGRFANRDRFAAYNGTAPIEVGSGGHHVHRLSRRGNRQLNHAIHMAAITQIRHAHSPGRALLRPQARRRQDEEGSAPRVEAAHQRRASTNGSSPTPARRQAREGKRGRQHKPA